MKFGPHIHRRRSIRLKDYDYSQSGAYFITIVPKGRANLFGEIIDGEMWLNELGDLACLTCSPWVINPRLSNAQNPQSGFASQTEESQYMAEFEIMTVEMGGH